MAWYISNEYNGECHCELCREAFRQWLREKYDNDLDKLNQAWWTAFWSHTYTEWSQVEPPSPIGGTSIYIASRNEERFTNDFYEKVIKKAGLRRNMEIEFPLGVTAQFRGDDKNCFVFVMNFDEEQKVVSLGKKKYIDVLTQKDIIDELILEQYGFAILKENHTS